MTAVRVPNTTAATEPPAPPVRPDGSLFPFEVIYGPSRLYADTHDEILNLMLDGYADLPDELERLKRRIRAAVDAQVAIQASLAADTDALAACTETQQRILLGSRDTPPAAEEWAAPIPLVLVTSFYRPNTDLPRPRPAGEGQIWWLDPTTATTLLESMHNLGWLDFHVAETPGETATDQAD